MYLNRFLSVLLILALLLPGCQLIGPQEGWEDVPTEIWWHDAAFYQIFVRSFADSDGDGIGDFKGLISRLDYLNDGDPKTDTDLGIEAVWLMPIFPSPSYHGYDVTDYYAVNPEYGSMEDFKTLLEEAHQRGIRVIIDFVINHTSDQHPWFQASASGDPAYQDWYIWNNEDPGYRGPWNQVVWHASGDRYYYGVFVKEMPDLNYGSEAVTTEILKVAEFWLNEVGVDGFRLDGAKHLIEDGWAQENTPATHAWFNNFYKQIKEIKPEAVLVGEIWSPIEQAAPYVNNDELDLVFNFPLADDILNAVTFNLGPRIGNSLQRSSRAFTEGRYAPFLANHDQTRVMTKIQGDILAAKAAAVVLLTAPGTPFIYYGEEIGMTGDKPDPNIRTPMQWTADPLAGFTTGTPWKDVNADYAEKNVETQNEDQASLLNHYRQLIHLRNNHYALREGEFVQVTAQPPKLFAMLRVAEKETILVLVNLDDDPVPDPRLKWEASSLTGTLKPTILAGEGEPAAITVNEQGGIEDFQPVPEVAAGGYLIVQYRP